MEKSFFSRHEKEKFGLKGTLLQHHCKYSKKYSSELHG